MYYDASNAAIIYLTGILFIQLNIAKILMIQHNKQIKIFYHTFLCKIYALVRDFVFNKRQYVTWFCAIKIKQIYLELYKYPFILTQKIRINDFNVTFIRLVLLISFKFKFQRASFIRINYLFILISLVVYVRLIGLIKIS